MAYMMAVAHIMRRNGRIEVVEPVTTIVGRWIKSGLVMDYFESESDDKIEIRSIYEAPSTPLRANSESLYR